jgi:DNA-binding NtrC family response regulator
MENYSEMTKIRTLLKKVGCSVESTNSDIGIKERIIASKPDLLLVSGVGKKINPVNVSKKIKEIAGSQCKVILILAPGIGISLNDLAENKFDGFLESPFDPSRLIYFVAKFSNGKANDLEEKFQKMVLDGTLGQETSIGPETRFITGSFTTKTGVTLVQPTPKDLKDKISKYNELVKGISVSKTSTISKLSSSAIVRELKKNWDRKLLDDIDEEKRKVVGLLFKK